jgi:hypothetical protein
MIVDFSLDNVRLEFVAEATRNCVFQNEIYKQRDRIKFAGYADIDVSNIDVNTARDAIVVVGLADFVSKAIVKKANSELEGTGVLVIAAALAKAEDWTYRLAESANQQKTSGATVTNLLLGKG